MIMTYVRDLIGVFFYEYLDLVTVELWCIDNSKDKKDEKSFYCDYGDPNNHKGL